MNDSRSPDRKSRPKSGAARVNSRDGARSGARDSVRGSASRGNATRSADAAPRPFDPNRATPGSATERLLNAQPRGARSSGGAGERQCGRMRHE